MLFFESQAEQTVLSGCVSKYTYGQSYCIVLVHNYIVLVLLHIFAWTSVFTAPYSGRVEISTNLSALNQLIPFSKE